MVTSGLLLLDGEIFNLMNTQRDDSLLLFHITVEFGASLWVRVPGSRVLVEVGLAPATRFRVHSRHRALN
jgi:hypothetical protein